MLVIKKNRKVLRSGPASTDRYENIPVPGLRESPTNLRRHFDEASLRELSESIREKGLVSPLLVRPVNGHFEIVAGARSSR
jgi:ParB family chromosome partitioning protein